MGLRTVGKDLELLGDARLGRDRSWRYGRRRCARSQMAVGSGERSARSTARAAAWIGDAREMEEVESTLVRVMTAAEREWWRRERDASKGASKKLGGRP